MEGNPLRWSDPRGLAIGDFPPAPPGYSSGTWKQGQWSNGKYYVIDPNKNVWTVHREDDGHWRHWDKQDSDGDDDGTWPPNSKKPWPTQKKLKNSQCPIDPSGDEPQWQPLDPDLPQGDPYKMIGIMPGLLNPPSMSPIRRTPIRVPVLIPY